MTITIQPNRISGSLPAIASKSAAHRLLLCAALSQTPTVVSCETTSADIDATIRCLVGLGAGIKWQDGHYLVHPLSTRGTAPCRLDCGESGSTLRFLLPVAAALGRTATFQLAGRLFDRPMDALEQALTAHGCRIERNAAEQTLTVSGKLTPGAFTLPGDISSQFISGLLFALPLLSAESTLVITGKRESVGYIDLTLQALQQFYITSIPTETGFLIAPARYESGGDLLVEGDWSNAAPFFCMAALGGSVRMTGLSSASLQGDKAILPLLAQMGASVKQRDGVVTVTGGTLHPCDIDARDVPDLVPVLAAVAAAIPGRTHITGAARLRLKESDRLSTTAQLLNALGGTVTETPDGLDIDGKASLRGGTVFAHGDHRIAMAAAVASVVCQNAVTVENAESVEKSYPTFWEDLERLKNT